MSHYPTSAQRKVDWTRFANIAAFAEADSPRMAPMPCKKFLAVLASKNDPPAARLRKIAGAGSKRRRGMEDELASVQPQPKVLVTEELRANDNARYSVFQAVTSWTCGNSLARWVRREVGECLAGTWARFYARAVQRIKTRQESAREQAKAQQWVDIDRRARTAQLAAEIRASLAAAREGVASSPLAKASPRLSNAHSCRLVNFLPPPSLPLGLVRFPPPGGCDPLPLAEDHVYPEFPNLEGDGVDEDLFMTGGAGPAGTLTYESEGEEDVDVEMEEEEEEDDQGEIEGTDEDCDEEEKAEIEGT